MIEDTLNEAELGYLRSGHWEPDFPVFAKLLRLYDAATARAEAADLDLERERVSHGATLDQRQTAESRLAAATTLLDGVRAARDKFLELACEFRRNPQVHSTYAECASRIDSALSATPAPAATAEPDIDVSDWRVPPKSAEPTLLERIEAELDPPDGVTRVGRVQRALALIRASKQGGSL